MYFLSIYLTSAEWGENHRETAACYINIGWLFFSVNNYESAVLNFMTALGIQKNPPDAHRDLANTYYSIGYVYLTQNEDIHADDYLTRSLNISLKSHSSPKTSLHIANTYRCIGVTHENRSKLSSALAMYIRASEIFENVYSSQNPCHSTVLDIQINIRNTMAKIGIATANEK